MKIKSVKFAVVIGSIVLLGLAIGLWFNTPELFNYFNQAFCSH